MLCPWNTFLQIPSLHSVPFSLSTLTVTFQHQSNPTTLGQNIILHVLPLQKRWQVSPGLSNSHPQKTPLRLLMSLLSSVTHSKSAPKTGRDSSQWRPNKDTQKSGLWLWFQVFGYATDFHKTWANPQISHTELLLEIQLLTLPHARKNCFSAAQGLPLINSNPTLERIQKREG